MNLCFRQTVVISVWHGRFSDTGGWLWNMGRLKRLKKKKRRRRRKTVSCSVTKELWSLCLKNTGNVLLGFLISYSGESYCRLVKRRSGSWGAATVPPCLGSLLKSLILFNTLCVCFFVSLGTSLLQPGKQAVDFGLRTSAEVPTAGQELFP